MEEGADADADDVDELETLRLLVPNLELSTGCSPQHLPGNPPSTLAQSLSQRLLDLLHSTRLVRAKDLRILYRTPPLEGEDEEVPDAEPSVEVKAYWVLYIDILFISLDGNAFDTAWLAVLAALKNTRLPRAWWDADVEGMLCSDAVGEARALKLRGLPVPSTFAVFDGGKGKGMVGKGGEGRRWVLADADAFEEGVCRERVTVVVDEGRVKRLEKSGGVCVGVRGMRETMGMAEGRWEEWRGLLEGV